MADAIVENEVPATTNAWFTLFRLYETLIAAGWTHFRSSRGTADTPSGTDRWAGAFGSLVADAWIILTANSGQQLVFRRGTSSSTTDGWIVWLPSGGAVSTNETALLPGDLPADAVFIRGTGATPQTYTTDGSWFGASTNTVATVNIGCRDATGVGDESFWVVAQVPGNAYNSGTATNVHRLLFDRVEHMAGLGISDTIPYAWWCPESNTGNWADGMNDLHALLHEDNSGNTAGVWRRWWNAGQGGAAFKLYGAGANYMGDDFAAETTGDSPNFDGAFAADSDEVRYQATPLQLLRRIRLTKVQEVGFEDPEGGFTQNTFFVSDAVVNLDTMGKRTHPDPGTGYAITGSNTITRNDGGNWYEEGYRAGGQITIATAEDAGNNGTHTIASDPADTVDGALVVTGTPLTNNAADTTMSVTADGIYAKFGDWLVVWWGGDPTNPPVEN